MTKHTCNAGQGPAFGRKSPGCPRCDELLAGSAPRQQAWRSRETRAQQDARMCAEIRAHSCQVSNCGPVCTFGEG